MAHTQRDQGERTLRRPELRPLWQTVHNRLSSGRPVTRVRLGPLDGAQYEALADLLGLDRLPDPRPFVALVRLDEAVTELSGRTVRETVTELVGPLGTARPTGAARKPTCRAVGMAGRSRHRAGSARARRLDRVVPSCRPGRWLTGTCEKAEQVDGRAVGPAGCAHERRAVRAEAAYGQSQDAGVLDGVDVHPRPPCPGDRPPPRPSPRRTGAPCGLARASPTNCRPPSSSVDYARSVKVRSPV